MNEPTPGDPQQGSEGLGQKCHEVTFLFKISHWPRHVKRDLAQAVMGISVNVSPGSPAFWRRPQEPCPQTLFCISISLNDVGAVRCSPSPGIDQLT